MSTVAIRELTENDLEDARVFCDQAIGDGYYSLSELRDVLEKSRTRPDAPTCSFVLTIDDQIKGIRFSYPPGRWHKGKGQGLRSDLWNVPLEKVGYFQSLFLAPDIQGKGFGAKLSEASLVAMKRSGAPAVVTHAWCESPNDSSRRYLRKIGFTTVARHPRYWHEVDYVCPLCGKPCLCTAEEMIKYL